ncbi:hypothetical protein G5B31_18765 [Rhodobacter sp. SGA-6-6]|nr:hypothetical protein [Rhodobacter sp. SGA-6-6]
MIWTHDVFGNSVAIACFSGQTDRPVIESRMTLNQRTDWPVFDIDAGAGTCPFCYSDDEKTDLGRSPAGLG